MAGCGGNTHATLEPSGIVLDARDWPVIWYMDRIGAACVDTCDGCLPSHQAPGPSAWYWHRDAGSWPWYARRHPDGRTRLVVTVGPALRVAARET